MPNIAYDLIWPTNSDILLRVVFLYVGQGHSTIVLAAKDETYEILLVDINLDRKNGGINVPKLMKDLLEDKEVRPTFVNTHPHRDHLSGIAELADAVELSEVWHSGHRPGKAHADAYDDLQDVIKNVTENGGEEVQLLGSREVKDFGEAKYYVLSPAKYVVDEIEGESDEERYRRIHEQCAVLRIGTGETWVMLTGDADRDAWEKHIADYHSERLAAHVLMAPHHGSRTFFKYNEEDDPYTDALQRIGPDYVVISAPTSAESPHDHPHTEAVELYEEEVGKDNVLHTGERRHSFICDLFRDHEFQIESDDGDLVDAYGLTEEEPDNDGGKGSKRAAASSAFVVSRIDERPMGQR